MNSRMNAKLKLIAKSYYSVCLPLFNWNLWFVSWAHTQEENVATLM